MLISLFLENNWTMLSLSAFYIKIYFSKRSDKKSYGSLYSWENAVENI